MKVRIEVSGVYHSRNNPFVFYTEDDVVVEGPKNPPPEVAIWPDRPEKSKNRPEREDHRDCNGSEAKPCASNQGKSK